MKLLLDTHILIWAIVDHPKLSAEARRLLSSTRNPAYLSVASLWEIAIKTSLGKLSLGPNWSRTIADWIGANSVDVLPLGWAHCTRVARLPFVHRDPFDRLLVAQALEEKLTLLSVDPVFDGYGVERRA